MDIINIDFETYYDPEYSLRKMTTIEYIMDDRFKAHGLGYSVNHGEPKWVTHKDIPEFLESIDWDNTALLAQNTMFDAGIMAYRYGVRPAYYYDTMAMAAALLIGSTSLAKVAQSLLPIELQKGNELVQSKGIRNLTQADERVLAGYCRQDVRIADAIFMILKDYIPEKEFDIIDMHIRMYTEPKFQIDADPLPEYIESLQAKVQATLDKAGYTAEQLASNDKFIKVLEENGVLVPMKHRAATKAEKDRGIKGPVEVPALSKNDEGFMALAENPRIAPLIEARLEVKSRLNETRAQRFIDIHNAVGALPVPLKYCGAHCVPGKVEVLTQDGWTPIEAWQGGTIAQVTEKSEIVWRNASRFAGPVASDWVRVKNRYIDCDFTLGHTMPYLQHGNKKWATMKAEDLLTRGSFYQPTAGCEPLNTEEAEDVHKARVIAMIQADGSFEQSSAQGRGCAIFVKKDRKKERARELLEKAGVPFRENRFSSHPGYSRFSVRHSDYPEWMGPHLKHFDTYLLDLSPEAKKAFIEELLEWDGCKTDRTYNTVSKNNAEWVQTISHLIGQSTALNVKKDKRGGRQDLYRVRFSQKAKDHCVVDKNHIELAQEPKWSYCPETQTGFWLARSNGKIFVTGNTGRSSGKDGINLQNLPGRGDDRTLRNSIIAPPGHKLVVIDSGQIEARVLAYIAKQNDIVEAFRQGIDPYKKQAAKTFGLEVEDIGKPSRERDIGKAQVLGLGYGMGGNKFRLFAKMTAGVEFTDEEAAAMVQSYRKANHRVKWFWDFCDNQLVGMSNNEDHHREYMGLSFEHERIVLPSGRFLNYTGLRYDFEEESWRFGEGRYTWGGTIVENIIQAVARDIVFYQTLELSKKGYKVANMVHDEAVLVVPDSEAEKCLEQSLDIFRTAPEWYPDLPLSADGGIADNYGEAK